MKYEDFLESKVITHTDSGFDISHENIHSQLFDFQKDIVKWACQKGKAAIFADCGLGKTLMQLEWARFVFLETGGDILIVAPLAVSLQTVQEGKKINIAVNIARSQEQVKPGINITNYEMLSHFNCGHFKGVVLDESSILKAYSGKIKQQIIENFKNTPYKLCCTATPSPNDHMEILNHADFLNVLGSHEALAIWFINDTMQAGSYRLKNHAVKDFWKWVSSWAVSISKPSDFGYKDNGFKLPDLNIVKKLIPVDLCNSAGDMLFRLPAMSATDYHKEKRLTVSDRALKTAEIVNSKPDEIFMVWCETNYEADELKKALPDAIEVRGDDKPETKEKTALDFANGKIKCLISKPSIFGFGMNFQICHNVIFCGLSYSYESFYQATRRFWRFGQTKPVNVYIIIGDTEKNILDIVQEKEEKYMELKENMQDAMNQVQEFGHKIEYRMDYERQETVTKNYRLILGDSVEEIKHIESNSIGLSVFSPPFSNLYIYSDSYRDMGNCKNDDEFFKQFDFLIPELYRITIPGRLCCVHTKCLIQYKNRDGHSGLRDFPGDIVRAFIKHGWVYHSKVVIWKDPVIEMQRTKSHGLLYKQLRKDSSYSRQGIPDEVLMFRKWDGEDLSPVTHTKDDFPLPMWQKYASPVWDDIRQTNCLNIQMARDNEDEKHICPLQLDVIERCITLWSNPGDTVFSPFAGIGSEGYQALKMDRKFIGIELKESYYKQAIKYLNAAKSKNIDLFENYESELAL